MNKWLEIGQMVAGDSEREQLVRIMRGPTGHHERLVPEVADPGNLAQHLKRYYFARPYCVGKLVLDVGTGVGYGANLIAQVAEKVYGIDYDPETIRYASQRYGSKRLEFFIGDVASLPFQANSMDVVVSLEVIEHVPDHNRFLKEVCRVLKPEGISLVSTPNEETTSLFRRKVGFTYEAHVSEVGLAAFRKELQKHFAHVRLFGMRLRGNAPYTLLRALDPWNL